jgi:hypothetical protein
VEAVAAAPETELPQRAAREAAVARVAAGQIQVVDLLRVREQRRAEKAAKQAKADRSRRPAAAAGRRAEVAREAERIPPAEEAAAELLVLETSLGAMRGPAADRAPEKKLHREVLQPVAGRLWRATIPHRPRNPR